ncbi:MAG TPA: N-acetylglucosamine-6-phosphate deacetylase [Polyangia bacterium]|jgi:N-acetylglucosamine-6-phosphate deacetylase|nr:N-acetylglucosamine-6-phosphate deacetylase [Polyangia bacterium]
MRAESRPPDNTTSAPGAPGDVFSVRGRLLLDGRITQGVVVVAGGRIVEVRTGDLASNIPTPVKSAHYVSPGLIDLQVNGAFGHEVGADATALAALAAALPATGVTSFLPTLVSGAVEAYRAGAAALRAAEAAGGARRLGLHLEGPMLSPARVGAHDPAAVARGATALASVLDELIAADVLRIVTIAPERPGALALIRRLRDAGVVASLGHTDATFEEFVAGADAGASFVTHLYNAMRAFQHREPGSVGAALTDDRLTVGLIADGVHAHPVALDVALRAKGWEHVALVTDAVSATGRPPGTYALGGAPIVSDGQAARRLDGTLAGSTLTLDRAVRVMLEHGGAHVGQALSMATQVPARLLEREDLGRLAAGCLADLVLWSSSMEVEATYIGGRLAFAAPSTTAKPTAG